MPMARSWNGLEIQQRVHRAAARSIIGIGMEMAMDGKRISHHISGTLVRSIHVAPLGAPHGEDEKISASVDMMFAGGRIEATKTPLGPAVEVGSWLPYACVEWVGRDHPGITQALEAVRGARADMIVATAWREEGLI